MKKLILALVLLFTGSAQASIPGSSNSVASGFGLATTAVTVSGYTIPISSLSSMSMICAGNVAATSLTYSAFYAQSAQVYDREPFLVPGGKTFYGLQADFSFSNPDNSTLFGYGTGILGSDGTGTAPSGAIKFSNTSPGYFTSYDESIGSRSTIGLKFPAGTYPFVEWLGGTASSIFHICIVGILQ